MSETISDQLRDQDAPFEVRDGKVVRSDRNKAAERLRDGLEAIRDTSTDSASRQLARSLLALLAVHDAAEHRATVDRHVALLDALIAHPRNEPRYRAAYAGLKVARRAILDEEAAR